MPQEPDWGGVGLKLRDLTGFQKYFYIAGSESWKSSIEAKVAGVNMLQNAEVQLPLLPAA